MSFTQNNQMETCASGGNLSFFSDLQLSIGSRATSIRRRKYVPCGSKTSHHPLNMSEGVSQPLALPAPEAASPLTPTSQLPAGSQGNLWLVSDSPRRFIKIFSHFCSMGDIWCKKYPTVAGTLKTTYISISSVG
ncbi:hypothetical protein MVEN_00122300 [Mycena venus]|uniref:Uncharacterized protein n=1 Tax=Mycena venus TaxID=2733690 RepID=A0A8H7DFM4_9AGAR|nr:hypothetical protein MVEN_00122300 [Mycena venus]